jgi:O-antigen ligase
MNSKATDVENYLTLAILTAYPVLLLVMRGSMSALFFLMTILSIASLLRSGAWLDQRNWNARTIAFAVAMASATTAILPAQIYHQELAWRPYDEAARLLLAVPIYLAIQGGKLRVARVLGISMSVGVILAMIVVGGASIGPTKGRFALHFLNVIHFGDLALILGFMSLFSIHVGVERSPISITVKLCGLLVGIYLSFRTGTRGGWLLVPVLLVIWIMLGLRLRSRTGIMAALGLIAIVGVATLLMYDVIQQRVLEVQSDLAAFARGDRDTSIGIRLQILQVVAHVLQEHPLVGAGPQGYKATLSALGQAGVITAEAVQLGTAEVHNQILSYTVKYGLLGLVSGLAIHLVPLVIFVRALKVATGETRIAVLMGICLTTGFLIFGLTVEIFNLKHTITFYSFTLAVLLGEATRDEVPETLLASAKY